MTELIEIRASSSDRIMICNASSAIPEMKFDTSGEWANFGTAVHEIMAQIVRHNLTSLPDLSRVIDDYKIEDEKAMRICCYRGLKEFKEVIAPSINRDHLISEEKHSRKLFDKYLLSGHPDIACLTNDPDVLFVGDWKNGVVKDHFNQLKAYAYILLDQFPSVRTILLGSFFLRENEKSVKEFTREEIEVDWAQEFYRALEGDSFKPTFESCQYCPRLNCTARNTLTRDTAAALVEIEDNDAIALKMANKYEDVQLLERMIIKYKDQLKDHLRLTGEKIPVDSGKILQLIEGSRSTLYLWDALEILKDYFGTATDKQLLEMLKEVITIKKTGLMDIIGQHAAYRMKGKERKRITEEMEARGAIKTKTFDKLALKKDVQDE